MFHLFMQLNQSDIAFFLSFLSELSFCFILYEFFQLSGQ